MLNMVVMKFPRSMHYFSILVNLFSGELRSAFNKAMRRNWHDVRRAIREPNACACKRDLHHVFSEVAGRMQHVLVCSSDVATRGVVVGAKVSGHTPPFSNCK